MGNKFSSPLASSKTRPGTGDHTQSRGDVIAKSHDRPTSDSTHRLGKISVFVTFGRTELILSPSKLLSHPQVTPILTNMYIIHNNAHMGP